MIVGNFLTSLQFDNDDDDFDNDDDDNDDDEVDNDDDELKFANVFATVF